MDMIDEKAQNLINWLTKPLMSLVIDISDLLQYTNLVSGSLSVLAYKKTIDNLTTNVYNEDAVSCNKVTELSHRADIEINADYPHLTSQFVVTLFSYLDGGIKNLVISTFRHFPESLKIKEVADIQISISEYRTKSNEDILHYIYKEYERTVTKGEVYGTLRFEKLLAPLGFHYKPEPNIKKDIFELARLRNIIVHNSGKADPSILKFCPQLNLQENEKAIISKEQISRYAGSVAQYLSLIATRINKYIQEKGTNLILN